MESLIKRSGKKAIVFRTKIGEKSFLDGNVIRPYYKDKADWRYIESLIEATMQQKLRTFDRSKIIQLSKTSGSNTLLAFKKKVDERLLTKKINSFEYDILTNIQAYLEIVLPKLQSIQFADSLALVEGLNIMDLERFSKDSEVQSLIIRSTVEEVLYNHKDVIIVIPEAWRFLPQSRGNPCKQIVEEFIRQGATNRNFIWIDSQELTGVDKTPLKQITEWILGYQSEKNEVKHTLDQLPLAKSLKPKEEDIMSLGTGMFYYATRESTRKVYAQPFWLDDEKSKQIALGTLSVKNLDKPKTVIIPQIQNENHIEDISKDELVNFKNEIYSKLGFIEDQIQNLQKLPNNPTIFNKEELINEIMARMPKSIGGNTIYQISPLEKLNREFLDETKTNLLNIISGLDSETKKMLKYLESRQKGVKIKELLENCFHLKATGGNYDKPKDLGKVLENFEFIRYDDKHTTFYGELRIKLSKMLEVHQATPEEIDQTYNHIIFEILSKNGQ